MSVSSQNIFKAFIQEIFNLPFWIKQIIYLELKEQLEKSSLKSCLSLTQKHNSLQLYIPKLTYTGKNELNFKTKKLSEEVYAFLECAYQNISIIEISIKNNWNLCECSNYFLEAVEADLAVEPPLPEVKGTALYMSGKIRLGEYFVKINRITIEQLDEALRKQKHLEESLGDRPGLAEILVSLKFLSKDDTEGILLLKEDCKKYFKSDLLCK